VNISSLILVFVHIPVPEHQNMLSISQNQVAPNPLDANLTVICTPSPHGILSSSSSLGEKGPRVQKHSIVTDAAA